MGEQFIEGGTITVVLSNKDRELLGRIAEALEEIVKIKLR